MQDLAASVNPYANAVRACRFGHIHSERHGELWCNILAFSTQINASPLGSKNNGAWAIKIWDRCIAFFAFARFRCPKNPNVDHASTTNNALIS